MNCQHPRAQDKPLCMACYRALADEERHYMIVCLEARRQNLPLVTKPHSSITGERAAWIAGMFGYGVEAPAAKVKAKPVESPQTSLFDTSEDRTVASL